MFMFNGVSAQNVGIGQPNPGSKLSIAGNVSIGSTFSGLSAPANGLIVEGRVGIGTANPAYKLDVYTGVDWGGMRVHGAANTQLIVESPSGQAAHICWVQAGVKRFCMSLDTSGQYLEVHRFDNLGNLLSDSTLVIDRLTGFVGLGIRPSQYRLELPNIASPAGRGISNQWLIYSDSSLKRDIVPLNKYWALNAVMRLKPVSYVHHSSYFTRDGLVVDTTEGEFRFGFVAQDVAKVIPSAVEVYKKYNDSLLVLSYSQLLTIYVAALQAQTEYIDSLEKQIARLEHQVNELMRIIGKDNEMLYNDQK